MRDSQAEMLVNTITSNWVLSTAQCKLGMQKMLRVHQHFFTANYGLVELFLLNICKPVYAAFITILSHSFSMQNERNESMQVHIQSSHECVAIFRK